MKHTKEEKMEQFGRVLDIMDKLRAKCPWNAAQTWDTLRPMTVEEVYELSDAVMKKEDQEAKKELGDLLLHIVFYSKIAEEQGKFDVADVMDRLCEKMTFRHPHVFSDTQATDAEQVSENWEMMKMKEKGANKRILSGVPDSMPPNNPRKGVRISLFRLVTMAVNAPPMMTPTAMSITLPFMINFLNSATNPLPLLINPILRIDSIVCFLRCMIRYDQTRSAQKPIFILPHKQFFHKSLLKIPGIVFPGQKFVPPLALPRQMTYT